MPDRRFSESELAVIRRSFARQMMALANVWDARIEQAFATIRREDFLGSEPWQIAWLRCDRLCRKMIRPTSIRMSWSRSARTRREQRQPFVAHADAA